jgi:hypothetical protein
LLAVGGVVAASCGQGVAGVIYLLLLLWYMARTDGMPVRAVLAGAGRALGACAAMGAAVLLVRGALAAVGWHGALARLAVEVSAGAAVYVLAAFVIAPRQARDLLVTARGALGRRPRAQETEPGS